MLAKDIWKKVVRTERENKEGEDILPEQTSFQRKIDPSLDDIYSFRPEGSNHI